LQAGGSASERKVLVYTRNFVSGRRGYVHENIQASIDAIYNMGRERSFGVDVSDAPSAFNSANLVQYDCVIFSNTNNEAFSSDSQREAFARFIESGGGFVGIHSAAGSERTWPYFWSVLGGRLAGHSKIRELLIHVENGQHPATQHFRRTFPWTDECYYFADLNPAIEPLLWTDVDETQPVTAASGKNRRLLAWYFVGKGGSRRFYTALGHASSCYADPQLYQHIRGGIDWVMRPSLALTKHRNGALDSE
jgi:type 1 glutamine amidotransferase